ncbi:WD40 repeat domain-containing protein [Sulfurimonas sp. HSL1-6]|uniref:WD40 repeat domain-containing protein n=1 Tax=Thiomicrolovo immobilis TaxID=3131935 RepID=UPI0031F9A9D0
MTVLLHSAEREACFEAYRAEKISKQALIECLDSGEAKPETHAEKTQKKTSNSSGLYLADSLPYQVTRFVESFDCFNKDDMTMLYTYTLALKYRMQHVDSMEDLEKSDIDYWRLWHIVSDLGQACKLHYSFDNVLEAIITPTQSDQKALKKLRRVEGRIHTDGSSESSQRMREYDAKLRARVLANKPAYSIEPKDADKRDYDLTSLKKLPANTIPANVYESITKMETTPKNKEMLFRLAYLKEETLRHYDHPKKRHEMQQEIVYLEQCQRRLKLYQKSGDRLNQKRKLASSIASYSHYYPLKTDFLPNEISAYCENNITAMTLAPLAVAVEKPAPKHVKMPVFATSQAYINSYRGAAVTKTKMQAYLNEIKSAMGKQKGDMVKGLKVARLQDCIRKEKPFLQSLQKDIDQEGLKEEFTAYVIQPMFWWATTIAMKIEQEGESEELKNFFDCNQTSLLQPKAAHTPRKTAPQKPGFTSAAMRAGIHQKDSILKYYAKVFENRPSYDLTNAKAVDAGIIDGQWIDKDNKIIPAFGSSVRIEGMPQGGMKLTYADVPGGKLCSGFVSMNQNDAIHFDRKTYEGIDYILLNNHKLRINHMVGKHVERLCDEQENNSVSFVKERTVKEHKYGPKPIASAFDVAQKTGVIRTTRYAPNGFAHADGGSSFFVSGQDARIFDKKRKLPPKALPRDMAYSFQPVMSPDGKTLAVGSRDKIYLWDIQGNKLRKTLDGLPKGAKNLMHFLSDNKTLVAGAGKSIYFFNTENENIIEITPKFIEKDKKYFTPRISAVGDSPDGTTIYIGSSYGHVERWKKKRGVNLRHGPKFTYLDTLEDKQVRDIGAIAHDPRNPDHLMVCNGQNIRFWDVNNKSIVETLDADVYMRCTHLEMSKDRKYLMASSEHGVFLWKLGSKVQYEILTGGDIKGALFIDNNHIATIGREIALWQLEAN